ncbi:AzlC family ABC transporter permease [Acinetobacter rudis]|uniref:AzlC family ABC transporter permease n=1 Tax=Acinetobacter rudis TaxID=632955 RepID=A0AAW8J8J7_9GAMM|nr:AzlC family ABC transporter permease [Acinetobacter rudis]MDQ8936481.1 AzlC family ABC transporter permease [Acinetobacter rudis]MDQ8952477.1 AzlC family ABC transporter permease [Acinetobacter rudis]MDQ9018749.1 AzlC family ABC transporter permease [Acinetobacter rudis]
MLPLSIAVIPWGILAGSMAIHAGLSWYKALAMSALVFAGTAQLVSLGLVMAGASVLTILVTVYFTTTQHLIYALHLRDSIATQDWYVRLAQAFLLTDEQFALAVTHKQYHMTYLFGSGLCFYLFWVFSSAIGIVFAQIITDFQHYPLDFSVVAIFIPMILALTRNLTTIVAISSTVIASLTLKAFQIQSGLLIAAAIGMLSALSLEYIQGKKS